MILGFRLLEYFLTMCEELHFTKAAEKLGISQPTLSQQIKLLESHIGSSLFHREGRKIELTDAGEILLSRTHHIFSEMEQAKIKIQELNGLYRDQLKVGCSGNYLLYNALVSFYQKYPNIKLSVIDTTTEDTLERLLKSEFDIGIVFLPVYHDQIEISSLFKSELCLMVPDNHSLALKEHIHLKELQSECLFLTQENYLIRRAVDDYCHQKGFSLNPIIELSDIYSLIQMTILHNGATILPKEYAKNITNLSVKLIQIADPLPIKEVGVIYRKGMFISSSMQAFLTHLTNHYDNNNNN